MFTRRHILAALASLPLVSAAQADTSVFYAQQGAALRGYDTVAYFTDGAPVQGKPNIAVMWKGVVWHFASEENREAFEANPRAFAPQFGGFCAYAVAQGYTIGTDPLEWDIVDGKLYLTHSRQITRIWEKDVPGYIRQAEQNWPQVLFD